MGAQAGKNLGSNCVTPMPIFLPNLQDIEWLFGVAGVLLALFEEEDFNREHTHWQEAVHTTIDNNNFLPTTYDDYRDWPVVVGTGGTGRV